MKVSQLSECFNCFEGEAVSVNTKLQVNNEQGIGLITFRGILFEKDDYMVYLGNAEGNITSCINWNDIASIEILDLDAEANDELMKKDPISGAVS